MIQELSLIKTRWYLIKDDKRKMIPTKYHHLVDNVSLNELNFEKVFLTKKERFLFEVENLKETLKDNEPYLYELISKKKVKKVYEVKCKESENRFEIKLGSYSVVCSKKLFDYSDDNLKELKHSYH